MTYNNRLQDIKELAITIDHNMAFGGKSKGNNHLLRVVKIAKFIAKKTHANLFITLAGAYLHDTALPSGNDYDYEKNKKIAKDLLKSFHLTKVELEAIAECVASHEGTVKPKSLEAQIVHDADVLEKLGPLGIIRHTWKMVHMNVLKRGVITDKDVRNILGHILWRSKQLQTPIAKKMAKYLIVSFNNTTMKKIISLIADMVFRGMITEKIAIVLRKHFTPTYNKKLREQLTLSYLKKFK